MVKNQNLHPSEGSKRWQRSYLVTALQHGNSGYPGYSVTPIEEDPTIARRVAVKIDDHPRRLFGQKKQEITYGTFLPTGAVRAVMEGVRILYLGGWATSAKGSDDIKGCLDTQS